MYTAKDFTHLLGLDGFSDALLTNHFTLYQGYVTNTNKYLEKFDKNEVVLGTPECSELQRRLGWEWNGMRMHELYFGNLSKHGVLLSNRKLREKIERVYGSYENWEKSFIGTGMMRGVGWVVLAYDKSKDELFNIWVGEHDEGYLTGTIPLLVMDVWEHAFMLDYGIKRADYINVFMKNIDWHAVEERV